MSTSNSLLTLVLLFIYVSSLAVTNSLCGGGPSCSTGQTCCNDAPFQGCCPYSSAVCCTGTKYCCPSDYKCCGGANTYCCPNGYTCNDGARNCIRFGTNAFGEAMTTNQQPAKLKIQQQETTP
ncbi:Cysteine peptidase, asparagine active site-containing protein [Artemisia annua]|uniref:Cysteine peptidase, asparagine active site-containing protein n=1 Tax=Artemisia annua TaxID=35608 RepID=A0A2U1PCR2_ARTAN|nr:Cysteine peptidase, asparagine active site-containing protein [Artemisia annua]